MDSIVIHLSPAAPRQKQETSSPTRYADRPAGCFRLTVVSAWMSQWDGVQKKNKVAHEWTDEICRLIQLPWWEFVLPNDYRNRVTSAELLESFYMATAIQKSKLWLMRVASQLGQTLIKRRMNCMIIDVIPTHNPQFPFRSHLVVHRAEVPTKMIMDYCWRNQFLHRYQDCSPILSL